MSSYMHPDFKLPDQETFWKKVGEFLEKRSLIIDEQAHEIEKLSEKINTTRGTNAKIKIAKEIVALGKLRHKNKEKIEARRKEIEKSLTK